MATSVWWWLAVQLRSGARTPWRPEPDRVATNTAGFKVAKADPTCAPYGADRLAVTPDRNRLRKRTGPLAKVEVTGHHAAGDGGVLHRWPVAKPRRVATAVRLVRKRLRPRCSRDMTVPSGQSVRAAISLHENSKTSA